MHGAGVGGGTRGILRGKGSLGEVFREVVFGGVRCREGRGGGLLVRYLCPRLNSRPFPRPREEDLALGELSDGVQAKGAAGRGKRARISRDFCAFSGYW